MLIKGVRSAPLKNEDDPVSQVTFSWANQVQLQSESNHSEQVRTKFWEKMKSIG